MKAIVKPYSTVFIFGLRDEDDKKYFHRNKKEDIEWNERMLNILNNLKNCIWDIETDEEYRKKWKLSNSLITDCAGTIIQVVLYVSNAQGICTLERQELEKYARRGVRYYDI